MKEIYLNADKTVSVTMDNDDNINIKSSHGNLNNAKTLVNNLKNSCKIVKDKKDKILKIGDIDFVKFDKKGNAITLNELTSFETRVYSQGKGITQVPFKRGEKVILKTDLHTHFAGQLSPENLIDCAIGQDIYLHSNMLGRIGIDTNDREQVLLEEVISNKNNYDKVVNSLKIDTSEQETFNKMEQIYANRGPFTKNPKMFMPIIEAIAKQAKSDNVSYLELSLSSVISDPNQLQLLNDNMPAIEKEYGVQIRFLGAFWRHSDKEWNRDEVDRLKVTAKSPYVVGCDFMGHETNSTKDFSENIVELAKWSMINDPSFVIRVHSGENPLFKNNIRDVLLALKDARDELELQTGKKHPFPQVRIGHGIYGFDVEPSWDEPEKYKNISTIDLCKEIDPIIEFNVSSNLSLNNINNIDVIPIKDYLDNGIRVVLGTDGQGIYSTSLEQEVILARQAGLTTDDFKKIQKVEDNIMNTANKRFKKNQNISIDEIRSSLKDCYRNGEPEYNDEVYKKYSTLLKEKQAELSKRIEHSNAITDTDKINKDLKGKIPIMITGSSAKHYNSINETDKDKISSILHILTRVIDPEKTYIVTGGTNHGVEKNAHEIIHEYNKDLTNKGKTTLSVLGTLTVEAAEKEFNSVEKDTITHAMIANNNGRPAQRWFDLPDAVLNMLQEEDGLVFAIAGGPIVSDIIQRSHNNGQKLMLMNGPDGASSDKSKTLKGNNYDFSDPIKMFEYLKKNVPDAIRKDLNREEFIKILDESITQINMGKTGAINEKSKDNDVVKERPGFTMKM